MAIDLSPFADNTARLPSIPRVMTKIVELARSGDVDIQSLSVLIASDPALAAKTLQFANSPMYANEQKIETLRRAIVLLGLDTTVNLALSFSLTSSLKEQSHSGLHYPLLWRRSLLAAAAARELGRSLKERALEELFLAGLLQDIGMIAIDRLYPDFYTDLRSDQVFHQRVREYEIERIGGDHAEAGAWLCKHWGLAARTTLAVATSHRPATFAQSDVDGQFVRCVCLSGIAADYIILGEPVDARKQLYLQAQRVLSMAPTQVDDLIAFLHEQIPEMESLFDIKLTESASQSELLEQANETLAELNLQNLKKSRAQNRNAVSLDNENRLDSVSGAFSRKFMNGYLPDDFNLACRAGRVLSILLLEIKNIKNLRKILGDEIDAFLSAQFKVLKSKLRAGDMVFRYNDNSFLFLLHDTLEDEAAQIALRLADASRTLAVQSRKGPLFAEPATGIATHGNKSEFKNVDEWIDEANAALHG
ncbi:HDOD domain-containing protein [uncultured Zhongshania sp.]|uniref:sensor domain-containing diguanylate cyclase n=1 Tax=uncultured Zhongshania sp. TaxID=1642288 RepID=UPI0030DC58F6|tara:strand:+ start:2776 stop:4206 length:1431 start_codon:yes stop_codon:yes gene_type:complete